ncbi:MAG: hypothetical protein AMJ88_14855 [Anaerolineae bacterium SM23_ 63]|nr:MAG: hypothetical protein AMJ88_14855 [Anaerolineae bacterium SM23_ 63]HEY45160.1 hypothetical protein [Anaerolineae bacterium]
MDRHMIRRNRLWYGLAALVLVLGCLAAVILIISTLISYPSLIKEAYKGPLQKVEVPGEADIDLRRKGAYGVYYEAAHDPTEVPPVLDCSLTSKTTGEDIPLVPDYVPTNRYSTKDGNRVGVLIYSTTVKEPSLHTLSCDYPDGRVSPKLVLAIGPNYIFEFLRVAWNMGGSILGGAGVLCGSFVLSVGIVAVASIRTRKKQQVEGGINE